MSRAEKKADKDEIASLPFNSKTHATLKDKVFISLYAEDLYFLTTRAGWKVRKIYDHYTYKQSKFKKDFVIMNQNARKTAKTKVEKDFYKLLNNSNFGNDCRNNIDQCNLTYDGFEEIKNLKRFTTILQNWRYREFFSLDLMQHQVHNEYNEKKEKLDPKDEFYIALINNLNQKKRKTLKLLKGLLKRKRTYEKFDTKINTIENKISSCTDIRKNKMIIEFNNHQSSSVKNIAVKYQTSVNCSTRFVSGKLLMFAKLTLKIFIYLIMELLSFPDLNLAVAKIY